MLIEQSFPFLRTVLSHNHWQFYSVQTVLILSNPKSVFHFLVQRQAFDQQDGTRGMKSHIHCRISTLHYLLPVVKKLSRSICNSHPPYHNFF